MKILHTADWHIGQIFYNHDRTAEHGAMFDQLGRIVAERRPDAMIVAGDIFDNMQPSAAAARFYIDSLLDIRSALPQMQIIVTGGNHDSPSRLEVDASLWQLTGVTVVGDVAWTSDGSVDLDRHLINITREGELIGIVAALPYLRGRDYGFDSGTDQRGELVERLLHRAAGRSGEVPVVLAAHDAVRGRGGDEAEQIGNLDYTDLAMWRGAYDYLALGHIHRPHTLAGSGSRARYAGTPLQMSFDEVGRHSVSLVTLNGHDTPEIEEITIEQPYAMVTVPPEPAPLEEALDALRKLPGDVPSYVRLNVSAEGYIPASAHTDARAICENTALRYCDIIATRQHKSGNTGAGITLEAFRRLSPAEVIERHFAATGVTLTERQQELIKRAIGEAEN